MENIEKLHILYEVFKERIELRINEFKKMRSNSDESAVLKEFIFCLLTPQSKAKICWKSVEKIFENNLHIGKNADLLREKLGGVRFPNNKSKYLIYNLEKIEEERISLKDFVQDAMDSFSKREILIKKFKGMGMKEASHFLRNTGHLDLAILDRHILKNMVNLGILNEIPSSISKNTYVSLERKLKDFSEKIGIPFAHLDMLLWAKETGEVFK